TSLRHLLQMSSGVRFIEDYSGNDDVMKLARATFVQRGDGGAAAVTPFNERVVPSGTRFYYASAETERLGLVLRSATGRPVTAYLEEKIWQPMGAEADATWLVDRSARRRRSAASMPCCATTRGSDSCSRTTATGAAASSSRPRGSGTPPRCAPINRISARGRQQRFSATGIRRGSSPARGACSRCSGFTVSRSSSIRRATW